MRDFRKLFNSRLKFFTFYNRLPHHQQRYKIKTSNANFFLENFCLSHFLRIFVTNLIQKYERYKT